MLGNWFKTSLLMAAILALFGIVGAALGGGHGMLLALGIGGVMNFWAYWFSDRVVLSMYNAREVEESTAPQLHRVVRELSGLFSIHPATEERVARLEENGRSDVTH